MTMNKLQALLDLLLSENTFLSKSLAKAETVADFKEDIRAWLMIYVLERPHLKKCCESGEVKRNDFDELNWKDVSALRIKDYLDHAGIRVRAVI